MNKKANQLRYSREMFSIIKQKNSFLLNFNETPLKTPGGNEFTYKNSQLLDGIIGEIVKKQKMDVSFLCMYSMYCTFRDFAGDPDYIDESKVKECLLSDLAYVKAAYFAHNIAPSCSDSKDTLLPIIKYFYKNGLEVIKPLEVWEMTKMTKKAIKAHDHNIDKTVAFVKTIIHGFTLEEKTALINSNKITNMFIPGLLLTVGFLTPIQYAQMNVGAKIGESLDYVFPSLDDYKDEIASHKQVAETIRSFLKLSRA
jgi:hypothetical protein